ncbi:MAG: hypothetical protein KDJ36_03940 [Hyphomicrobiaceae bacterium]|nr:hypothetical protein [Hyphomicrobiaceae bacterium]
MGHRPSAGETSATGALRWRTIWGGSKLTFRASLVCALAVVLVVITGSPRITQAAEPAVVVGKRLLLDGTTDTPFPIQVTNPQKLPKNSFIRIRGSFEGLQLSRGHRVSATTWAIPLNMVSQLTVRQTTVLTKPRSIRVMLVALDGTEFRTFGMSDVMIYGTASQLAPPPKQTAQRKPVAEQRAAPVPRPPVLSAAQRARAEAMLKRGQALLANGDIDSARAFFRLAAKAGLAEAALAMGSTYDPARLRDLPVVGLRPDVAEARRWYARARNLGSSIALTRLRDLGAF